MHGANMQVTIFFDLRGFGLGNMDYQFVKFLSAAFERYYPESMHKTLVLEAPWLFQGCWFVCLFVGWLVRLFVWF